MTEVLVVGAGPVGLTMAAEAARYGLSVRIIDSAARATETSKALVLWSRSLELIDRMGCTPAFLAAGFKAHGASIRSGTTLLGQARFDDVASAYNYALMIPQRDTERLMTEHLATFGVTVERETRLTAFTAAADHVEAHLLRTDGKEVTVTVPWLVGCDGAHSTVRHGLGVEFIGQAHGDDWILGDVRLEGTGTGTPPADEIAVYLHRDRVFTIFPIPGGFSICSGGRPARVPASGPDAHRGLDACGARRCPEGGRSGHRCVTARCVGRLRRGGDAERTSVHLRCLHFHRQTVDWDKGMTINDMPLNAAICEPAPHAILKAGQTIVRGYAIATAREIARVDISPDGGRTWMQANLNHDAEAPWSWTFWSAVLDLATGDHELTVRAWDSTGQTQPAQPDGTWNFKGYLSAAWHRVPVSAS